MKLFFVEVQTYSSCNQMLKNIGELVSNTFNHCVISSGMWNGMLDVIERKMNYEKKQHPHCHPVVMTHLETCVFSLELRRIVVKTENTDNVAFVLTGKEVKSIEMDAIELNGFIKKLRHDYGEGGEK